MNRLLPKIKAMYFGIISIGTTYGACMGGMNKFAEIYQRDDNKKYTYNVPQSIKDKIPLFVLNPFNCKQMKTFHHGLQIGVHVIIGAVIGGLSAVTFPVSIPGYWYYVSKKSIDD